MPNTGQRIDPFPAFKFCVEIDSITQAVFSECSGLEAEVEVFEYEEGGLNDYVHKLPGRVKYSNLTLKRGMASSDELWDWYKKTLQGTIERKNISVTIYDTAGEECRRWNFQEAYPIKWTGPDFKADDNAVAIETLVFSHRGMQLT
jgi:phage tail-like protein